MEYYRQYIQDRTLVFEEALHGIEDNKRMREAFLACIPDDFSGSPTIKDCEVVGRMVISAIQVKAMNYEKMCTES